VAEIWRAQGVPVVSADELAREAVAPESEGLAQVVAAFGSDVLTPAGELDRARVRDRVFRDPVARRTLEAVLHPRIAELRSAWIQSRADEGHALVVSEIPLLFEVGLEGEFDTTVLVDAPEAVRLARLVNQRGLAHEEAVRIMRAQMDPAEKRARADLILDNDGTLDELRAAALALLSLLTEGTPA
jgi:dephospho-CoA kinase